MLLGATVLALLVAACQRDGRTPLVIYSPHGRDLLTLLERRFEQLHPDVDVRWLDMGSQEVYDRLRSEGANPQADVWFGGPATIFARGARDSLLEAFRPSWADAVEPHGRGAGDVWRRSDGRENDQIGGTQKLRHVGNDRDRAMVLGTAHDGPEFFTLERREVV